MGALVSLVIPCYNEEDVFPFLRAALENFAQSTPEYSFEFVLVDDGSRDKTWALIREFAASDCRVRGILLSRNFGHQMALSCGYELARGEAVVCLDADLQDPPALIGQMLQKWAQGDDIVYAIRNERAGEGWFKLWSARWFYRVLAWLGAKNIRSNCGDFRLLSRRALDTLNRMHERHRFIRGMVGWLGFREAEIYYDRPARAAGQTKYPLVKMMKFAADALVSFSLAPLRLAYLGAAGLSLIFIGYLVYVLAMCVMGRAEIVLGWPSLILAVTGFGAMNLVCLGLIGEYVGRIFEQSKGRPLYLVMEDTASSSQAGNLE